MILHLLAASLFAAPQAAAPRPAFHFYSAQFQPARPGPRPAPCLACVNRHLSVLRSVPGVTSQTARPSGTDVTLNVMFENYSAGDKAANQALPAAAAELASRAGTPVTLVASAPWDEKLMGQNPAWSGNAPPAPQPGGGTNLPWWKRWLLRTAFAAVVGAAIKGAVSLAGWIAR